MVSKLAASTIYVCIRIAIASGIAASVTGLAQAQDSLQASVSIVAPPPTATPLPPEIITQAVPAPPVSDKCQRALVVYRAQPAERQADFLKSSRLTVECLRQLKRRRAGGGIPLPSVAGGQHTKVYVNIPLNPTYETDVLKTGSNSSPGASAGFGGNVMVTTGVGSDRPFDLIAFAAGSASARYPAYSSKNLDTATAEVAYQFFLDAYTYNPDGTLKYITKDNPDASPPKMITIDTLALAVLNQTAFMPTYRTEIANLLTPQIILSRQNIDLSNNAPPCRATYQPPPPAPANEGFCYFANLSLTAGQTFSDVLSQQNANIAGSAALGWRVPNSDWTLSLQGIATARDYEDFVGGRSDLLVQAGPVLAYAPSSNVTFSMPISYFKNYSTVSAAVWSGFVVQPTLTIAFSEDLQGVMPHK
jgi:hypothetical protein